MAKTIAAISSANAPGGIGIIRVSGGDAKKICDKIFTSKNGKKIVSMKGYTAALGEVRDAFGEKIDDALALVFTSPKSYTGEDVVEISCHGGIYIMSRILKEILSNGAFPAEPGEFTKRAFLNGKMDLMQAEAVMQIISANGKQASRAALAGGGGVLSKKIKKIKLELEDIAAHLAAWADFPDEDIPQVDIPVLTKKLVNISDIMKRLLESFGQGRMMREGVDTVIAGSPNAGKSTLMNLLSGCERSIVTQYAGTTRDVIEDTILLGDIPLRLADTAGIRNTSDPVERIGIDAAKLRLKSAQLLLVVFDASRPLTDNDLDIISDADTENKIAVINKTDLEMKVEIKEIRKSFNYIAFISAEEGTGLNELQSEIRRLLKTESFNPSDGILYTERQRADVESALSAVSAAYDALKCGFTLDAVTICVEEALTAIYDLSGEKASENVVNTVFEKFCVGK